MVIGNLEMAILLMRAEFLAKSIQAGTLNKFSKVGLESQEPSVLSDHCNAEITHFSLNVLDVSNALQCPVRSLVMYCHIPSNVHQHQPPVSRGVVCHVLSDP